MGLGGGAGGGGGGGGVGGGRKGGGGEKGECRMSLHIRFTFSQRVLSDWNRLPVECINATSVNMFKNRIDQYFLKTTRSISKVNCWNKPGH